ncbi:MAG: agmatine deiminase [Oceanospirillaceae bacterium]|uniref:agmatine deiminase n=1 Tax=unclassified Thalassolituus TaxID=2624967 RepID=UPI000C3C370B|nr:MULTISPECIES: agmatine deiminase [unclassified Thalassolituus]MBS52716.1 agmatine deiminase [Oceanospirillaceae bacterium]|tara:strand:- start:400 stop:1482 length:1083 start_codon:yes stop_codon:yes gene_type:complete
MLINSTPFADGFHMPAEHAPHSRVWLAWPVRGDNWRDQGVPGQAAFARFIKALVQHTPVGVAVTAAGEASARAQLPDEVKIVVVKYNDAWMRDMGPTFVVNDAGEKRAISWQFNAWGGEVDGLYPDWSDDDKVASVIAVHEGVDLYQAPFVLEGGSIHVDGEGTLYTTAECLQHVSRNPHLSKADIEQNMHDYLGVDKVIWLPTGLYDDETNGHVDNILHVVRPGEVMLTVCEDESDPQYALSQAALALLRSERDAQGREIRVYELPLPGPLFMTEEEANGLVPDKHIPRHAGERLGASYANFLISNKTIFYPLLDENNDDKARAVIQEAYPDYELVGLDARDIVLGGGNLHCISQQVPA